MKLLQYINLFLFILGSCSLYSMDFNSDWVDYEEQIKIQILEAQLAKIAVENAKIEARNRQLKQQQQEFKQQIQTMLGLSSDSNINIQELLKQTITNCTNEEIEQLKSTLPQCLPILNSTLDKINSEEEEYTTT